MDCVGLAGLRHQRDRDAAPDGSGAESVCPIHVGWHCRGGRYRRARSQSSDAPGVSSSKLALNEHNRLNGGQGHSPQQIPGRRGTKVFLNPAKPILGAEASAILREKLMGELKAIASPDDAAIWAHRILDAKNSLTAADARQVEDAFRAKRAALESAVGASAADNDQPLSHVVSALQPSSSSLEGPPVGSAGQPLPTASTRAGWPIPSRAAFVTRSTSGSWPNSRV